MIVSTVDGRKNCHGCGGRKDYYALACIAARLQTRDVNRKDGMSGCACGCGVSVTKGRRFVAGHNMRLPAGLERAGKRVWTADEDATLARLYPNLLTEEVARMLRRSLRAVYARAKSHGLQKSEAFRASGISGRLRPGDENPLDLDRARAVADVARVIVDSAKVEVDFLKVTGASKSTDFLPDGDEIPAMRRLRAAK